MQLPLAALAALLTLARPAEAAINFCGQPTSLCDTDSAISQKAAHFENRVQALNNEIQFRIDPKLSAQSALSSQSITKRQRGRWHQIEEAAMNQAHLSADDLRGLIKRVRRNLRIAIRRAPQLAKSERTQLLDKVENVPVHLPSESTQPVMSAQHCGKYGSELQAFAIGVDQETPEVVLCPGLLLLENLTAEHETWVLEGLPSPVQTVIAHELAHHFLPSGQPAPGQKALRSCLVDTLGIADRPEQLEEVAADFWASEMAAVAIESPLDPRNAIRNSLVLATLPVCVLEQRLPPENNPAAPDAHFRALPRMTLSLSYHPRLHEKMGCEPFSVAQPTCDLGGTFPK